MEYKKERILDIHVAVNIKCKKILFMNVTIDEHAPDGKALPELVDDIIKSISMIIIGKLLADYNDIFRCISYNGIHLCIY
jgi:hypothetical protein